jgi:GNAT superfamily N-acetyltransferase
MNDNRVLIRSAIAEDAGDIHRMVMALASDIGLEDQVKSRPEDFLKHGFGDTPCFNALLAEQDGEAVGLCLFFTSFSSWGGKRGVYVQDIYVDKSMRGTGLGQRLLAETARRAAEQGAVFMRLAVDRENQGARKFYAHLGMTHADHDCIYKAWDDAFVALQQGSDH